MPVIQSLIAVHEVFAKLVSVLWQLTLVNDLVFGRLHIGTAPMESIYPEDEESGCQAFGIFVGSNRVKAIIDTQQVDEKCLTDNCTTDTMTWRLCKQKALSDAAPNALLLHNGKSARDRNHMVASQQEK